jgi:hypothetical protein
MPRLLEPRCKPPAALGIACKPLANHSTGLDLGVTKGAPGGQPRRHRGIAQLVIWEFKGRHLRIVGNIGARVCPARSTREYCTGESAQLSPGHATMQNLIESVEMSLAGENWYAALAVALTIPDVCASLEAADNKTSRKLYAAWFERYLSDKYGVDPYFGERWLAGDDCYALRCSVLHNASDDISEQPAQVVLERFVLFADSRHCQRWSECSGMPELLVIDVSIFCRDLCDAARAWAKDVADNLVIRKRIKEMLFIRRDRFPPE